MTIEEIAYPGRRRPKSRRATSIWRTADVWLRGRATRRLPFVFTAALTDGITALAATLSAEMLFLAIHGKGLHASASDLELSGFLSLIFVAVNVLRGEYDISGFLAFAGHARRVIMVWNIAFLAALLLFFMTKQIETYSRGSILFAYGLGGLAAIFGRALLVACVKEDAVAGTISAVRVVAVGYEDNIRDFLDRYQPWTFGVDVVASFVLRGPETLYEDLALARASARVLLPDDIYVLLPLTEPETIDTCIAALVNVPASIHIGPQHVLDRFSSASISRVGKIHSLHVVRRPLTAIDIAVKRAMDLMIALPLLVCLAPLLLVTALAIKLESRGPVFFLQRRYGFNQKTFWIVKFRSMLVAEDGRQVRQAIRNDPRITRLGRLLRRLNIDELPQLVNVVRGDMSLVGPRPHALIHNQYYEQTIAEYARRHNVKPGITGWAQIHGLRGEVSSADIMRQRVEYDLYYIDNWSIGLDLRVLVMTAFSRKAFVNAY